MKRRWLWMGAIALLAIILLTLLAAPNSGKAIASGSTYNRSPDGYGAWYAYMEKQGTPVKRWQKPNLPVAGGGLPQAQEIAYGSAPVENGMTLLRVNSQLSGGWLDYEEENWVKKGNALVLLGVRQPVTEAPFSAQQESPVGLVKIDTGRRHGNLQKNEKKLLGDRFGAVVWQQQLGKGRVIFATTPHLAANAYQDEPGNYQFLSQLVTQYIREQGVSSFTPGGDEGDNTNYSSLLTPYSKSIWVDEYIHGYKDNELRAKEDARDWLTYLAKTPVSAILVQAGVILIVLVLAQNRRLGPPMRLSAPVVDNSQAYIQALAEVLQKAKSSEFVLEVIGKEEQLQLQKALGLGTVLVDRETLIAAWVRQTGGKATELEQVLQLQSKKRRIGERDLLAWLSKWQKILNYANGRSRE